MRLFLCEKPSQGKDIGRILGATQRGEGCLSGSGVTVTWCIGHLVEAAAPEVYDAALKRWSLEQLPIVPQQWRVDVKPKTATQFKVVKALLAKATHLVIATDADREGELIAREIIDLCGYCGPIERLWLSALNDASIRTALGKLRPSSDTLPMYYSALARSRADWLVGMNLSRLFTVLGRQAGYDGVLSVGRVQTPTLKLVVDRDREIAAFQSVPFWAIDASLSAGGQTFSAQWVPPDGCTDDAGRCLQQPIAQQAAQQIRAAGSAQVVLVETERVREGPPLLFDLGTLQEVCSKQLGLDVQETLEIAQALYETHKATTYPRSDSGYLPESMFAEVPTVLDSLLKTDPSLHPIMGQLDRSQRSRAWNDGKVTAHHGIIPTLEPANLSAMSEKELAVYRLIKSMKGVARFVTDPRLKQKLKDTTGIGTEATRANIITGLLTRGYLVKKGRSIRASDTAFTLIDAVPAAIADPGTTAVWEQALDMIEAGQLTLDVFIGKQAAWISQLIAQYGSTSLSIKIPSGPACPQCGAPTRQRTGKTGPFWSCSRYPDCKGTLPVESGASKRGASRPPSRNSSGRKGS